MKKMIFNRSKREVSYVSFHYLKFINFNFKILECVWKVCQWGNEPAENILFEYLNQKLVKKKNVKIRVHRKKF